MGFFGVGPLVHLEVLGIYIRIRSLIAARLVGRSMRIGCSVWNPWRMWRFGAPWLGWELWDKGFVFGRVWILSFTFAILGNARPMLAPFCYKPRLCAVYFQGMRGKTKSGMNESEKTREEQNGSLPGQ